MLVGTFCQNRNLRIIVLISRWTHRKFSRLHKHDTFSAKVARTKLASADDDARARHLWRGRDLQRNFYAQ
jgi:hypothetical protein